MATFRNAKYGSVEVSVLDPTLKAITDSVKIYLASSTDFKYMTSPRVISDLVKQFKTITGNDFRGWLAANYNEGVGVRAPIVRNILSFLNGEISGMTVCEAIIRDERKLVLYQRAGDDPATESTRHIADEHHLKKWMKLLNDVSNDDMFALFEGVGPQHVGRLIVSLIGEPSDV